MRKANYYYLLIALFTSFIVVSHTKANDYRVDLIPDSLKEGAVSVVRDFTTTFTQYDVNNGTYRVHHVITVLNPKGDDHADFRSYKDDFIEFKRFEGVLRNAAGKEIKKIKKSDLVESNISSEMATDTRDIWYDVKSPIYPYTVEYTYELQFKGGIINYPSFYPITHLQMSLEKAVYKVELPLGQDLRYYASFDCSIKEENTDKHHIYTFATKTLKPIKEEPLMNLNIPNVKIAPYDFCYDKICGNMSTWKELGIWQNKLLEGRDILPPSIVSEVKEMTKNVSSDREKVDILYKFLQNNMRYVSIQLGIGGWQPISAESTIKNRYGDCKGLSNLMKALLKAVDIPSNYTIIYSGHRKKLLKDFSDRTQSNHAILLVPLKNDSIWLECTSNTLPMGYIHKNIAGHNAIAMTEEGGIFCTLPSYTSDQNLQESIVTINVTEEGKTTGKMQFIEHVHGFGRYHSMMKSNVRDDHIRYIHSRIKFPKIEIGDIKTSEVLSNLPFCTLNTDFSSDSYITKTGQRLFIPLLPIKKNSYNIFKARERIHDIEIAHGFSEKDSITFNLPEGYIIESKPKNISLATSFGKLDVTFTKLSDNKINFTSQINIYEGKYDKNMYNEIKDFFQKIVSTTNSKMVIRKE